MWKTILGFCKVPINISILVRIIDFDSSSLLLSWLFSNNYNIYIYIPITMINSLRLGVLDSQIHWSFMIILICHNIELCAWN